MPRRIRDLRLRRRRTYLRQWREHALPELSLNAVAAKFNMSEAQLSRIERGISPYTQDFLELAAQIYGVPDPIQLLMHPEEDDFLALYRASTSKQRRMLADVALNILKPR